MAPEDPSGFSTATQVLNFRRPTASANESKVSSILNTSGPVQDIPATLASLMNGAAGLHEQRDVVNNPVPTDQRNAGRDFMFGVFFAQIIDRGAGRLDAGGALGGPTNLSMVPFTLGMNDPATAAFSRKVFNIFDAWEVYAVKRHNDCEGDAHAAIYRGQEIFNFNEFDDQRRAGVQRRPWPADHDRHLQHLPQHAQRGWPLRDPDDGHRFGG